MKKKFWTGRLKTILIIALVVAICAAVTLAIATGTSALENVVGTILSPIRAGVASIDRLAERYYNYMFRYESLAAENAEMEKQILAMQADVRDAEQLQRENEWLKALLQLSNEHEDYQFLTAYIISWDSSDYKSAFTIGKGTNAGLEEGMCAVTENGQVVGLVTKVGANWATITTIMDSSLEISASIASSGYTGVVQGTFLEDGTEILRMNYLLTDAIVKTTTRSSPPARRSTRAGCCWAISRTPASTRRALQNTPRSSRRATSASSSRSPSSRSMTCNDPMIGKEARHARDL